MSEPMFAGLKVLDVGSFIAGPGAATILSDFGADVIKVEPPEGDPWREQYKRPELPRSKVNYFWMLTSRNKKSLALNLKAPEAQAILHRLVKDCDVFVTNLPHRLRGTLGIDYEVLKKLNPRMIYASMSGYGETGEDRDQLAFDTTAWWSRSGLMHEVRPSGDSPPARSVAAMGDQVSGLALYGAIVSALYRRERTGAGGFVSSSLMATGVWTNAATIQAALCGAESPERPPRHKDPNPLNRVYGCRDGRWLMLTMNVGQQIKYWERFAELIEMPELAADPRFKTTEARRANPEPLIVILEATFMKQDAAFWRALFRKEGFAVSMVAKSIDAVTDKQMHDTGVIVPMEASLGVETVNSPLWIEGETKTVPRRAPEIGEHSDEILGDYGYSKEQIEALRSSKAVA